MLYSQRHRRNTLITVGAMAVGLLFSTPHRSFAADASGDPSTAQGKSDTVVVKPPIIVKDPPTSPPKK